MYYFRYRIAVWFLKNSREKLVKLFDYFFKVKDMVSERDRKVTHSMLQALLNDINNR